LLNKAKETYRDVEGKKMITSILQDTNAPQLLKNIIEPSNKVSFNWLVGNNKWAHEIAFVKEDGHKVESFIMDCNEFFSDTKEEGLEHNSDIEYKYEVEEKKAEDVFDYLQNLYLANWKGDAFVAKVEVA